MFKNLITQLKSLEYEGDKKEKEDSLKVIELTLNEIKEIYDSLDISKIEYTNTKLRNLSFFIYSNIDKNGDYFFNDFTSDQWYYFEEWIEVEYGKEYKFNNIGSTSTFIIDNIDGDFMEIFDLNKITEKINILDYFLCRSSYLNLSNDKISIYNYDELIENKEKIDINYLDCIKEDLEDLQYYLGNFKNELVDINKIYDCLNSFKNNQVSYFLDDIYYNTIDNNYTDCKKDLEDNLKYIKLLEDKLKEFNIYHKFNVDDIEEKLKNLELNNAYIDKVLSELLVLEEDKDNKIIEKFKNDKILRGGFNNLLINNNEDFIIDYNILNESQINTINNNNVDNIKSLIEMFKDNKELFTSLNMYVK